MVVVEKTRHNVSPLIVVLSEIYSPFWYFSSSFIFFYLQLTSIPAGLQYGMRAPGLVTAGSRLPPC